MAAAHQNGVDILLRNDKSGGLFNLRFCDSVLLFFFGWQFIIRRRRFFVYAKISSRVTISSA